MSQSTSGCTCSDIALNWAQIIWKEFWIIVECFGNIYLKRLFCFPRAGFDMSEEPISAVGVVASLNKAPDGYYVVSVYFGVLGGATCPEMHRLLLYAQIEPTKFI